MLKNIWQNYNVKENSAELVASIIQKGRLDCSYRISSKEIMKEDLSVWDKILDHCNFKGITVKHLF